MKTNFFENISALNTPGIWKLIINVDESGNLTVSELFTALQCGDKAANLIVPLNLTGTAQELDEGFFAMVTAPLAKTATLYTNMEAHLKSVEEAKLASKMEQDKKIKEKAETKTAPQNTADAELPESKISKEDKKKAYDTAMDNVNELIKKLKFSEALTILPTIEDYPNKDNELKKKRQFLEQQANFYEKALENFNA